MGFLAVCNLLDVSPWILRPSNPHFGSRDAFTAILLMGDRRLRRDG